MRLHTLPILSIFLLAACEPVEPCSDDSYSEGFDVTDSGDSSETSSDSDTSAVADESGSESGGWYSWSCCTCPERPEEDALVWTCKLDDRGSYFVCYAEQCEGGSTDTSTTSG